MAVDIIVDTREQRPLWHNHECIRYKLEVGDYSTLKLRERFCIERKSLQDLYGTIIQNHVRFRNEIIRAEVCGIKLILVIEGTRKNFVSKNFPGGMKRQTAGTTLDKIMTTVENKYGIEVVWCASRTVAKNYILKRLTKEQRLCGK